MSLGFSIQSTVLDPHIGVVAKWGAITLDASYAGNGWAVTPANLGMSTIHGFYVSERVIDGASVSDAEVLVKQGASGAFNIELWKESAGVLTEITGGDTDDFNTKILHFFAVGQGAVTP